MSSSSFLTACSVDGTKITSTSKAQWVNTGENHAFYFETHKLSRGPTKSVVGNKPFFLIWEEGGRQLLKHLARVVMESK